jgi:lysophospholipase L1-like esterase/LysM repeat protein
MKLIYIILLLLFSKKVFQNILIGDSIIYTLPKTLPVNKNLKTVLDKLYALKNNKKEKNKTFTILHIGDSHVQGDFFSGEIRRQLQSHFGFAGIGANFPYSLAKSYGPRGSESKAEGKWESYKILSPRNDLKLGILGYGLTTKNKNASIKFTIQEKFPIKDFKELKIWHSKETETFEIQMNNEFEFVSQIKSDSGWAVSTYKSKLPQTQFKLSTKQTKQNQNHFELLGFEINNSNLSGINYHHLGVVGAQFTHFIKSTNFNLDQVSYLKPDLIIFSFGTNEAYDNSFDSSNYYKIVSNYINKIKDQLPETGIIFTTAPDTRSEGRTPKSQSAVNNQLKKIVNDFQLSVFDLNEEMGGWGSLYKWHKNDLTLKDKLHFKQTGYALQAKLFVYAFLETYNDVFKDSKLNLVELKDSVNFNMKKILKNNMNDNFISEIEKENKINPSIIDDENKTNETVKVNIEKKISNKQLTHVVKKGESIYVIGKKYKINYKNILKLNNLSEKSVIRAGTKLIIKINK